jgi:hypothetical protein
MHVTQLVVVLRDLMARRDAPDVGDVAARIATQCSTGPAAWNPFSLPVRSIWARDPMTGGASFSRTSGRSDAGSTTSSTPALRIHGLHANLSIDLRATQDLL